MSLYAFEIPHKYAYVQVLENYDISLWTILLRLFLFLYFYDQFNNSQKEIVNY